MKNIILFAVSFALLSCSTDPYKSMAEELLQSRCKFPSTFKVLSVTHRYDTESVQVDSTFHIGHIANRLSGCGYEYYALWSEVDYFVIDSVRVHTYTYPDRHLYQIEFSAKNASNETKLYKESVWVVHGEAMSFGNMYDIARAHGTVQTLPYHMKVTPDYRVGITTYIRQGEWIDKPYKR